MNHQHELAVPHETAFNLVTNTPLATSARKAYNAYIAYIASNDWAEPHDLFHYTRTHLRCLQITDTHPFASHVIRPHAP